MIIEKEKKDILKSLGIEDLKEEDQDIIINKLKGNIERNVSLMVLDVLTEEDKRELEKIIDKEKAEEIINFLKSKNELLDYFIKAVAVSTVREFKALRDRRR